MKKYDAKLWDGIKNELEGNSMKKGKYDKYFIKIKFNLDDNLPLNKMLKLHRSVFEEDGKYYPQVFLDECLCEV